MLCGYHLENDVANKLKKNDVVIVSPITFLATANCIVYAGATPDFVDIDPVSYTIDPNRVIDASPDIKNQFLKNSIKNISSIIFSHEHADQTNG